MRSRAFVSKRRGTRLAVLVAGTGLVSLAVAHAADILETTHSEVSTIYDKSKDAVVKVHTIRRMQFGAVFRPPLHRVGTGFFLDGEGHVLTAASVVEDANSCWIEWRGRQVPAKLIGREPQTNIAMLKVDPRQCGGAAQITPSLALADSDQLRVGSLVVAIGFPYDLPSAPTVGFIRGFDVQRGQHVFITTHIRANCKLSPGQAGAPLLDPNGNVVGIAVAGHMNDQCLVLPINAARKICDDFLQFGEARIGWVGLSVSQRPTPSYDALSNQWQVFVQQVFSNSPAAEVGFRNGDILVRIHTNAIRQVDDVLNTMFYYRCGDRACFTVLRDGQEQRFSLTVGKRPADEPTRTEPPILALPMPKPPHQGLAIVPASEDR